GVGGLAGWGREPRSTGYPRQQPELPLAAEVQVRGIAVQCRAGRSQGAGTRGEGGVRLALVDVGGSGHGGLLRGYGWSVCGCGHGRWCGGSQRPLAAGGAVGPRRCAPVHGHVRQPYTIPIGCSRLEWVATKWFTQSRWAQCGPARCGPARSMPAQSGSPVSGSVRCSRQEGGPVADAPVPRGPRGHYRKSAERRRRIVAAAVQVFSRDGYRGATIRAIAAEAGMSPSSLLHFVASKQGLRWATMAHRDARKFTGGREGLRGFPDRVVGQALANEEIPHLIQLYAVLSAESAARDHPAQDYFATRFANVRQGVASEFAA